ncbi:MAG: nitronate monooxygenase [Fibrobacteres bacterium]|nr:nitronate monooxygenase [Fibrobacterota bacterium]
MTLPHLKIGNLNIYPPIVQGGMGIKVSLAGLASAVANCGGVGTISAAVPSDHIKDRKNVKKGDEADVSSVATYIRDARALTKGVIGVNIMCALTSYNALVDVAIKEKADIIFSGAGIPLNLPKLVEGSDIKIVPIVSSARVTDIICRTWIRKYNRVPDAIVLEGPLAGGHLGYSFDELKDEASMPKLETLLEEVLEVARRYGSETGKEIPVIVGGGIFNGADIAHFIKLGASGIQMGSRFVCTDECDASVDFKNAYVSAQKDDLIIIHSPVGMPGRALKNEFLEKASKGEVKFSCSYICLKSCDPKTSPYCIADALTNAAKGSFSDGFVFAGANVDRIDKIVSVKVLIDELVAEAEAAA